MTIEEYFHKTLFASIIVGPALAMTLPLVYWVQYQNMLFFPSFIYYVTGTGCISTMLYFGIYVLPDNLKGLKGKKKPAKQMLLLPPPAKPEEDSKCTDEHGATDPIIYNKVEEVQPVLSPSVPQANLQAQQEDTVMYKKFFLAYTEKYVKGLMSDEDAQTVLTNIHQAIDNRCYDLIKTDKQVRLPFETSPTSYFKNLTTEDLCHIGFAVKFFLCKPNLYGAVFIKAVFPHQLSNVELSTLATKLASQEKSSPHIPIPDICWFEHGGIRKKFIDRITDTLIAKL